MFAERRMLKAVAVAAFAVAAAVAPAVAEVAAPNLVGSYAVTGTDPVGKKYNRNASITLAPSGALELEWDNGRLVGVGHLIGDVLAVAFAGAGRAAILVLNVNSDGSLSGRWWLRTDPGTKGTETWKKKK
jgi:hypothetical protein